MKSNRYPKRVLLACAALFALFALAFPARRAQADFPSRAVYIGLYGGGNIVLRDWDLGAADRPFPLSPTTGGLGGVRLGVHVLSQLAIEAEVAYLPLSVRGPNTIEHALSWDIELVLHLLKGNWTPTLEAGLGAYHSLSGILGKDMDPRGHVGIGLRGLLAPWCALRVDLRDVISDSHDDYGSNNLELTLGLDFFLWRRHVVLDRDKDGVPDDRDQCPDQAGKPELQGCPDRDNDGIADAADRCPDKAGTPALKGCPDSDGDGVADIDDACPDVPAGSSPDAKKPGCPADRDGDLVIDEKDMCPDVPAGAYPDAKRPGCPSDRDGDGIIDEKDACPSVKGKPSNDPAKNGCPPDTDGDTVPDSSDACPTEVGAPDPDPSKNGCPGLVKIERGQIVILQKVYFATGKDVILGKSFAVLDAVANAVKTMPAETRIVVEGHTDNKGKADRNMQLSQRRALSVVKYLVGKGIASGSLEAQGFGQNRPVADNRTTRGREDNRRVEFHILDANTGAAGSPAP